ncbi:MAG: bifunctional D-glycero-beta-D-manno-heptose-7-phosphate kinase/D-glycero-beta-D-manno-heptose 1-phosphate adenylyltransferase HldE [Pseudomonadota bacterium]
MRLKLPDFASARVLVLGDVMLDRYWHGDTSRISPEAPVPVVKVGQIEERAGGAGNVALNITSLGGHSDLMGLVGRDEAARSLASVLNEQGVRCRFQTVAGSHTITKLRVISRQQQLIRADFEDGFISAPAGLDEGAVTAAMSEVDAVILSDYGKGSLRDIPRLIEMARAQGRPVLVDPKGTDFSIYTNATLITPNQSEFEAVVGPCATDEELMAKGEALRAELNLDALLVTRSEKGMVLFRRDDEPFIQPTRAREVFDVTGAGDTVIATLAASIAAGTDMVEATQMANMAAGIVVAKLGTATASVREMQAAMLEHAPLERGVVDEASLIGLMERARANGERVVMTNGCFDILHSGHVAYLSQAAALGDRLIVAVNSDDSVKRLKGPERPVNGVDQRMAVLSGLESVDWVVPFGEDTPQRLIEACLPDVLVKGGDYRPEDIAGGAAVQAHGGEVRVLDFVDGCSTSRIIEDIRALKA